MRWGRGDLAVEGTQCKHLTCCMRDASACWMARFLSLHLLFWNQTRITLELRPVISTRCSLSRASGRGLEAYMVLSVCSCCSVRTVLTRGPFSEFCRFMELTLCPTIPEPLPSLPLPVSGIEIVISNNFPFFPPLPPPPPPS